MFYLDGRSQADAALGAPVPNGFTLSAVTFDSDNHLVFDDNGSGCLELPDFDTAVFGSGREWTMDCYIRLSANSATYNNLWGQTNNSFGDNYLDESIGLGIHDFKLRTYYAAARCGLPESRVLSDTLIKGQWYFVAVDKYEREGNWHLCYYLDGAILHDCTLTKEILPWTSLKPCFFCSNDDSGRRFRGTVARPRISACALYRGQPFNVRRKPR